MIKIEEVNNPDSRTLNTVVDIHMRTFQGFFLTFMGRGFLRQLYSSYCGHPKSGLLIARNEENVVVGFLAYSAALSELYKYMIRKRLIPFGWYAAGAFLRNPKVFMRLVRAFLKPGESKRAEEYVKLASIGVRPDMKGAGVGSVMVDALKKRVDFDRYAYINLETDAVENEAANAFYVKNGFVLTRSFTTAEGRRMNEYRFGENV